jgi:hypothetical protein
MSNRRKPKDKKLAERLQRAWSPSRESRRKAIKADVMGTLGPEIDQFGLAKQVTVPDDEVQVIKEVPAVVTHPETGEKAEVGIAFIHDDGSVAIRYSEDAPEWALKYIKHTADKVGYNLETGEPKRG